jgi:pyridoxal phosphate enzyme (YggS family)
VTDITDHLADIVERVARAAELANRAAASVMIVAVSKQQSSSSIAEAFRAGQLHFGESYAQEAAEKMDALRSLDIAWHFIGSVQSNKTRFIAERFQWVHTVDRSKVAARLSEQRPYYAPPLNVLIQVNQAGEAQKGGVAEADLASLVHEIQAMPRLRLRGLMTIPPRSGADGGEAELWFRRLAELQAALVRDGAQLDTLSMGMSADFEAAIAAGANCVRIGTAIFGERP